MQYLTNAFIIDATASTTQSVVYPSTPPVSDVGDTAWIRGIGGGLSTASGSFNTDHLQIIGNRAAHGGDKVTGYNFASTISGFIITDKPVISMSPHQAVVCLGDTVVWSAYAVGVPPLSYQWRKNGEPIPGATTLAYGVTNVTMANSGTYDLVVTNIYGTAMSSPVTMDRLSTSPAKNLVQDLNPMGPEHSGLNNWATWLASSTDGKSVTRTGVMSFSATATNSVTNYSVVVTSCVVTNQVVSTNIGNQITVPGQTDFNSSTGTIMFWMRSSGVANPAGSPATLFDRLNKVSNGDGCVIVQDTDGTIEFQGQSSANGLVVDVQTGNPIADNNWHHVAVVYDQSSGGTSAIYIDGNLDSSSPGNSWAWQSGQELEWGLSHNSSAWQPYNGLMDDVRFYNRGLSATEVTSAYGGALVDTNALVMQLNFTTAPGVGATITWQCTDAILQSADSLNGPWTDLPGVASPYNVGLQKAAQFFRYRGHTPVVVISNPCLM